MGKNCFEALERTTLVVSTMTSQRATVKRCFCRCCLTTTSPEEWARCRSGRCGDPVLDVAVAVVAAAGDDDGGSGGRFGQGGRIPELHLNGDDGDGGTSRHVDAAVAKDLVDASSGAGGTDGGNPAADVDGVAVGSDLYEVTFQTAQVEVAERSFLVSF